MTSPEAEPLPGGHAPGSDLGARHGGEITGDKIKAVRRETRAGAIDCRQALEVSGGDVERAIAYLRERRIGTPKKVWT
jgi:hypothetical protein